MYKYKLLIAYDGTQYAGWQIQPNAVSIQRNIEHALQLVLKTPIRVIGSSRTDAGVHALGQVAHFISPLPLNVPCTLKSLNGILPHDIRLLHMSLAEPDFHAQFSSQKKLYHYHVWTEKTVSPFTRLYRTYFPFPLCLKKLQEGTAAFVGTKDFASFTNLGGSTKSTVRSLYKVDLVEQEGGFRLEFEGNGFLYKMVRNITGALLDLARGKISCEDISRCFAAKDRRLASSTASAQGLFLMHITYEKS